MPRVLIVEDNEMILRSIAHFLRKEGFDMASAKDGIEACAVLDRVQFDVVVTDLMMPFLNGIDVVKHIRKNPAMCNTAIIIVSGIEKETSIAECLTAGADEYIKKPIKPYDLVLHIKNIIERTKPDTLPASHE